MLEEILSSECELTLWNVLGRFHVMEWDVIMSLWCRILLLFALTASKKGICCGIENLGSSGRPVPCTRD